MRYDPMRCVAILYEAMRYAYKENRCDAMLHVMQCELCVMKDVTLSDCDVICCCEGIVMLCTCRYAMQCQHCVSR